MWAALGLDFGAAERGFGGHMIDPVSLVPSRTPRVFMVSHQLDEVRRHKWVSRTQWDVVTAQVFGPSECFSRCLMTVSICD